MPEREQRVKKVTSATSKEESYFSSFFYSDLKEIKRYLLEDLIAPQVKDGILKLIEMVLYGKPSGKTYYKSGGYITDYKGISTTTSSGVVKYDPQNLTTKDHMRCNFSDIIIPTKAEADEVREVLCETIDKYGKATIADFYDACGLSSSSSYVDETYGWDNLESFVKTQVKPDRNGWKLIMPKCKQLD